jgi:hypothetical protein
LFVVALLKIETRARDFKRRLAKGEQKTVPTLAFVAYGAHIEPQKFRTAANLEISHAYARIHYRYRSRSQRDRRRLLG